MVVAYDVGSYYIAVNLQQTPRTIIGKLFIFSDFGVTSAFKIIYTQAHNGSIYN